MALCTSLVLLCILLFCCAVFSRGPSGNRSANPDTVLALLYSVASCPQFAIWHTSPLVAFKLGFLLSTMKWKGASWSEGAHRKVRSG